MSQPAAEPPLVSVITPTLNQAAFLPATLASIAAQTYSRIEHIIIDGGSTDGTIDILERLKTRHPTRWISEPDDGMYDAVNKGLDLASGDIVTYLNSDDELFPWAIESAVSALAAHPAVGIVYGDAIRVDDQLGTLPWLQVPWSGGPSAASGSLIQPAVFWRRAAGGGSARFDSYLRYVGDLGFWLALSQSERFARVDELLALDRRHGASASVASAQRMAREGRELRERYRRGLWATALGPAIAHLRSSVLRRVLWVRFVLAIRGHGSGWERSREILAPRIGAGDAVLALIPGLATRRMGRVRWRSRIGNLDAD